MVETHHYIIYVQTFQTVQSREKGWALQAMSLEDLHTVNHCTFLYKAGGT